MKTKLLCMMIMIASSLFTINAQSTNKYTGDLNGGIETYYCIEKNNEVIRHGSYSYSRNDSDNDGGTTKMTITGSYQNNFKHGIWSYTKTIIDVENGYNNYVTSTIIMKLSYDNGMPNGQWTYSHNGKTRKRYYSLAGWSWGNYVNVKPTKISVNFSNGALVGNVSFNTPWETISGKLDKNSQPIGKWISGSPNITTTFINGIAIFDSKYDKSIKNISTQIANVPIDKHIIFARDNKIAKQEIHNMEFFNINDGYFDNGIWMHNEIIGDKTYTTVDGLNYIDSKKYGSYYLIKRTSHVSLKTVFSNCYDSETMKNRLDEYKYRISNSDAPIAEQMILDKIKSE